jgi:hypothetical protein
VEFILELDRERARRTAGMGSWEPGASLFSSPPLLDARRHFDLG